MRMKPTGQRCSWKEGCDLPAVGNPEWRPLCAMHRSEARKLRMAKFREAAEQSRARQEEASLVLSLAVEAAGEEPISELRAVLLKPATTTLARVLKSEGWSKAPGGGIVSQPYANGGAARFAAVLSEHGYRAEVVTV